MTYIIAEPCINLKDRSCVDVCPVDCIYEGEDQLYIHPDECIDCPGFSLQQGGRALRKSASNRLVARGCSRGAMCPAAGTT